MLHRALDSREGACLGHYKLRHVCPSQVTGAAREVGTVAWKQNKENERKYISLEQNYGSVQESSNPTLTLSVPLRCLYLRPQEYIVGNRTALKLTKLGWHFRHSTGEPTVWSTTSKGCPSPSKGGTQRLCREQQGQTPARGISSETDHSIFPF